jgi:hypothetical protein
METREILSLKTSKNPVQIIEQNTLRLFFNSYFLLKFISLFHGNYGNDDCSSYGGNVMVVVIMVMVVVVMVAAVMVVVIMVMVVLVMVVAVAVAGVVVVVMHAEMVKEKQRQVTDDEDVDK